MCFGKSDGTIMANDVDCAGTTCQTSYVTCFYDNPVVTQCPFQTVFDAVSGACTTEAGAGCENLIGQEMYEVANPVPPKPQSQPGSTLVVAPEPEKEVVEEVIEEEVEETVEEVVAAAPAPMPELDLECIDGNVTFALSGECGSFDRAGLGRVTRHLVV